MCVLLLIRTRYAVATPLSSRRLSMREDRSASSTVLDVPIVDKTGHVPWRRPQAGTRPPVSRARTKTPSRVLWWRALFSPSALWRPAVFRACFPSFLAFLSLALARVLLIPLGLGGCPRTRARHQLAECFCHSTTSSAILGWPGGQQGGRRPPPTRRVQEVGRLGQRRTSGGSARRPTRRALLGLG